MTRWQYVGLWITFFVATRFLLVNPILNVLDRIESHLSIIADVVRHQ